ncbi:MAG: hypothetical protein UR52_C0001G0075 [Candidatus Gottesmanbacteria bacterium GW2011_GWA1_34_13]|uniref:Glycosyltransferase RgtA/B/C/D-like domain-containing protein n=1 Tax=Candidatus Gottesmanbacteria bacterium GW2011_GWA1_34_13 TaxID=1618434 RepID=A0A0G0D9I5_9BACT|nr:MAG: hypothetical protein UR52_C0001G0075 [Candidatus Gottesmanbacteria bacterium GW2011_GWA1_34_13]
MPTNIIKLSNLKKYFVPIILLVGFVIRVVNPNFGSPVLYVIPDEVPNYLAAWQMLANKSLVTSSQYPPLGSHIMLPFFILAYIYKLILHQVSTIEQFMLFLVTHEGYFMFIPRIISALFGTCTVYVIFKITQLIFPKQNNIYLWVLFFSTFSITQIQMSHTAKPWMLSLFFYSLAIYWLIKYQINKYRIFDALIAVFFLSFAIGFHFSAVYGLGLIFIIWFFRFWRIRKLGHNYFEYLLIILLPILSFILFTRLMSYKYASTEFTNILFGNFQDGFFKYIIFYLKEFLFTEPVILLTFLCIIWFFKYLPKLLISIAFYSIVYFLFISITFYQSLRYMLPVLIIFPIFTGYFIYRLNLINRSGILVKIIYSIIIILAILPSCFWLSRYLQTPTFIQASSWINQNISKDIKVASTSIRFSPFVPNMEAINLIQKNKPGSYQKLKSLINSSISSDNLRNIIYFEKVIDVNNVNDINKYVYNNDIKYIFNYYWSYNSSLINKLDKQKYILIKRFSPMKSNDTNNIVNLIHGSANTLETVRIERLGPIIDIIQVK